MLVEGTPMRTIWSPEPGTVRIIDQTRLPWRVALVDLHTPGDAARAIATMQVRGAPLIGAAAAWGMALAMRADPDDLDTPSAILMDARPTAVNLAWAIERMRRVLAGLDPLDRATAAEGAAVSLCDADVRCNRAIGEHGLALLRTLKPGGPLAIMTICNAGWLATVDIGTATAPMYAAQRAGLDVHVTCLETRPRRQGALLTAWELQQQGVDHRIIVDSAAASVLAGGEIDAVIVGTDRTAANGDVCNKIGTYPLALAARAAGVPFWVAAPTSSIDAQTPGGGEIPIEERTAEEITHATTPEGTLVPVTNPGSEVFSPAFDVTPAQLVGALLTERGRCDPTAEAIAAVLDS